jgi:hypothetical protein
MPDMVPCGMPDMVPCGMPGVSMLLIVAMETRSRFWDFAVPPPWALVCRRPLSVGPGERFRRPALGFSKANICRRDGVMILNLLPYRGHQADRKFHITPPQPLGKFGC